MKQKKGWGEDGHCSVVVVCGWALESDCLGSNPDSPTEVLRPEQVTESVSMFRTVWFMPNFNLQFCFLSFSLNCEFLEVRE